MANAFSDAFNPPLDPAADALKDRIRDCLAITRDSIAQLREKHPEPPTRLIVNRKAMVAHALTATTPLTEAPPHSTHRTIGSTEATSHRYFSEGLRLNGLDGEMAEGIEPLFQTEWLRLRLQHQRLCETQQTLDRICSAFDVLEEAPLLREPIAKGIYQKVAAQRWRVTQERLRVYTRLMRVMREQPHGRGMATWWFTVSQGLGDAMQTGAAWVAEGVKLFARLSFRQQTTNANRHWSWAYREILLWANAQHDIPPAFVELVIAGLE